MHAMISCWKVWRRTGTFYTFHTCAERSAWTCVNGNTLARTHSPHDVHALCRTLPDGQAHNSGHTLSHTNTHTHAGKHTFFGWTFFNTNSHTLKDTSKHTHTHALSNIYGCCRRKEALLENQKGMKRRLWEWNKRERRSLWKERRGGMEKGIAGLEIKPEPSL